MARQKIIITLSPEDQDMLNLIISKGTAPARTIRRAHILLKSNSEGENQYTPDDLADLFDTTKQTVNRIQKEYRANGIECIYRKKRKTPPVVS